MACATVHEVSTGTAHQQVVVCSKQGAVGSVAVASIIIVFIGLWRGWVSVAAEQPVIANGSFQVVVPALTCGGVIAQARDDLVIPLAAIDLVVIGVIHLCHHHNFGVLDQYRRVFVHFGKRISRARVSSTVIGFGFWACANQFQHNRVFCGTFCNLIDPTGTGGAVVHVMVTAVASNIEVPFGIIDRCTKGHGRGTFLQYPVNHRAHHFRGFNRRGTAF